MTHHVVLSGWRPGLRKVSLTKLLREHAGLGLHEAHTLVDQLLSGENVTIPMPDAGSAGSLADEANALGAVAAAAVSDSLRAPLSLT